MEINEENNRFESKSFYSTKFFLHVIVTFPLIQYSFYLLEKVLSIIIFEKYTDNKSFDHFISSLFSYSLIIKYNIGLN